MIEEEEEDDEDDSEDGENKNGMLKTNHRVGANVWLQNAPLVEPVCMTQWIDLLNIRHENHFYHIKLNVLCK